MLQPHINQLVIWFVQVHVNNDMLVTCYSPHPKTLTHPSTMEMLQVRERTPNLSFVVFTFGFTFEFFEKCGGASNIHLYKPF
jgi:hypothetical protein